ncbi:Cysteine--tRNA ligase [Candidatus Gugararchaeum adminiculabundum]|nr:Cysteine--tRNA ligase [Candidatus Gugararchaeum adminiculabundum]
MKLKLFNTLTRKKERFIPIRKGRVGLYTCGPSVYGVPHIGNFRTYTMEDVLKRYLIYSGCKVTHAMNITDLEDKAVRAAHGNLAKMKSITEKNTVLFKKWRDELCILPPSCMPKASENISEMVCMIKRLLKKGYAYKSEDGSVFYSISKFKKYGQLSKRPIPKIAFKGRCVLKDDYFQREAGDFVLWKAKRKSDGNIFWKTELGKGRPGWNIECSAMSSKFLGAHFDIHAGGIDNIFSHHENEIAQSEGAFGTKFVNYWFHCRHLIINGEKMSKSLGNVYTLGDLFKMGFTPRAIRYLYLSTHYRRRLNFTFKGLRKAEKELKHDTKCLHMHTSSKICKVSSPKLAASALAKFEAAMDNDLDTPRALEVFCSTICEAAARCRQGKLSKNEAKEVKNAIMKMDSVLRIL